METKSLISRLKGKYNCDIIDKAVIINADCFEVLNSFNDNSIHAIVTDPPYGVKEYEFDEINKKDNGNGGVWRIPPSFDGNVRSPLPRFTALTKNEKDKLFEFFREFGKSIVRVLKPGGHAIIASNSYLSLSVFSAIVNDELEFRGNIVRLVRTLRGGDRPKNAETEFSDMSTMPRGCFEPWGLFRKNLLPKMKVSECLKEFQTGALRRQTDGRPFEDVIKSERTTQRERKISNHPSLKPQSFMRKVVYSALPLGEGVILDPFMGAGTTLAAANFFNYNSIGIERHFEYYESAKASIKELSLIATDEIQLDFNYA